MSDPNLAIQRQIQAQEAALERIRKADTGLSAGTAFPSTPGTNLLFYRSDLGLLCYYDGARWLTVDFWEVHFPLLTVTATGDDVTTLQSMPSDYAPWIIAWTSRVNTGVTNTGAAFWTLRLRYSFTTTISSVDTSALPAATNDQTLGGGSFIEPAAAVLYLNVRAEKTGAPSNLTFHHYARYRYVIP